MDIDPNFQFLPQPTNKVIEALDNDDALAIAEIKEMSYATFEAMVAITWAMNMGLIKIVAITTDEEKVWTVDVVTITKGEPVSRKFTGPTLVDAWNLAGSELHTQILIAQEKYKRFGEYVRWHKERARLRDAAESKIVRPGQN